MKLLREQSLTKTTFELLIWHPPQPTRVAAIEAITGYLYQALRDKL